MSELLFTPEQITAIERTRAEVSQLHQLLVRYDLVVWTGGNISGRCRAPSCS